MAIISKGKSKKHRLRGINITPFVDVLLVLLVVFMIGVPMFTGNINVDLPEAAAGTDDDAQLSDPIIVTVSKDLQLYLMDEPLSINELIPKIVGISKENKGVRIYVKGDKFAHYGSVIKVISLINQAGFNKVSLVTTGDVAENSQEVFNPAGVKANDLHKGGMHKTNKSANQPNVSAQKTN